MVPVVFEPSGPAAEDIGVLWWLLLVVGTAVFLLVVVLLVVPMVRDGGRRAATIEAATAPRCRRRRASRWIVGLGVVMPTVLLVGVLVATVWTTRRISGAAPAGAVRIEVVATSSGGRPATSTAT